LQSSQKVESMAPAQRSQPMHPTLVVSEPWAASSFLKPASNSLRVITKLKSPKRLVMSTPCFD